MRRLSGILLLIMAVPLGAQDLPDLSNYQHNWMIYNPAFSGSRDAASLSTFIRQKDFGDPGPMYQQIAGHTPLHNEKLALGVNFFSEQNPGALFGENRAPSPFKKSSLYFNYAYRIWAGDGRLSLGISAGITTFKENFSDLALLDPGDVNFMDEKREFLPNVGAGVLYYVDTDDKRFFVGLSVPYFLTRGPTRNSIAHDFNSYTGVLTGGYRFKIVEGFSMYPTALVLYEVGPKTLNYQGSINFGLLKEKVWVGAIYKSSNAISANINLEISKKVMIGYSYDYYLNSVSSYFSGSHELVLRYEFRNTVASKVPFYY